MSQLFFYRAGRPVAVSAANPVPVRAIAPFVPSYPLLSAPTSKPVPGVDVGVPSDYGELTPRGYTSISADFPNYILEGFEFSDGLDIYAQNVIVRNCRSSGASNGGSGPAISIRRGASAIIHNVEVTGNGYAVAIEGSNYVARNNWLHSLPVDGFKAGSGAWIYSNLFETPVWPDAGEPHPDGVQAQDQIRALSVVTGNWIDMRYATEHNANAGVFSNPNFTTDGTGLGWLVAAGNTLAGGGYPIYAANGSLGEAERHYFLATRNRIIEGSFEYASPVLLGNGADDPKQLVFDNTFDTGVPVTVESNRKGALGSQDGNLLFVYSEGETGTVNLGPISPQFTV